MELDDVFYYNEGVIKADEGKFSEALECFSKSEGFSKNGFPDASYHKGLIYLKDKLFEEALLSFTKAEEDSLSGYPQASIFKGNIHGIMKNYDKAMDSYNKAENDTLGENGDAIYLKGLLMESMDRQYDLYQEKAMLHMAMKEYEDCILLFKKCLVSEKHHDSSCLGIGNAYVKMGLFFEAIEYYMKLGVDNPVYPEVPHLIGITYHILGNFEKTIEYLLLGVNTPEPLIEGHEFTLGHSYAELGMVDKAIIHFNNVVELPSESPLALINMAMIYGKSDATSAINCLVRALEYEENEYMPVCYLNLSKFYRILGKFDESRKAAFMALKMDDNDYKIVENIVEYHSSEKTKPIYREKLKLLGKYFLEDITELDAKEYNTKLYKSIVQKIDSTRELESLYHHLMVDFSIDLPLGIDNINRLRLSYLLHFLRRDYHLAFFTIESADIDDDEFEPIDHYYFLVTAYYSGESINQLVYLAETEKMDNGPYSRELLNFSNKIIGAKNDINNLDGYLLDITIEGPTVKGFDENALVNELLMAIGNEEENYELPLSNYAIAGLATQLIKEVGELYETELNKDTKVLWNDISKCLKLELETSDDFAFIIKNIREGIRSGVPYQMVLSKLIIKYHDEDKDSERQNIALLQSAVLLSEKFDNKKHMPIKGSLGMEIAQGLAIDGLLYLTDVSFFGLGTAITAVTKLSFQVTSNNRRNITESIFENLQSQLIFE